LGEKKAKSICRGFALIDADKKKLLKEFSSAFICENQRQMFFCVAAA